MNARDAILERITRANARRDVVVPRHYRQANDSGITDPATLFAERVAEYRATVHRCDPDTAGATVAKALGAATSVIAPPGLPDNVIRALDGLVVKDSTLTAAQLDDVDAVVTTCAVAIALTGTIVLDHGPGQGHRALTLVPDHHVVLVHAEQVVGGVPDAIAALDPSGPLTWISGPSATSDIELERVEGVHGPRTLDVVLIQRST